MNEVDEGQHGPIAERDPTVTPMEPAAGVPMVEPMLDDEEPSQKWTRRSSSTHLLLLVGFIRLCHLVVPNQDVGLIGNIVRLINFRFRQIVHATRRLNRVRLLAHRHHLGSVA